MKELVSRIDLGFSSKDPKIIYSALFDYFSAYSNDVIFRNHPLGFQFVNLGNNSDSIEYRLHIWDSIKSETGKLQIHNHSFDFESFVVSGKLINTTFRLGENGELPGYLFKVLFLENKSFLERVNGSYFMDIIDSWEISEAQFYVIEKEEFHHTQNFEPLSISLIKMKKPVNYNAPLVFLTNETENYDSFNRSKLDELESNIRRNSIIDICLNHI